MIRYIGFIVLAIVLLMTHKVWAHDPLRPDLNTWYEHLRGGENATGNYCCNGGEATAVADPDIDSKDGHYRVRIGNQWLPVPDEGLIRGPNYNGKALVWLNNGYTGSSVRCFLPGAGT